MEMPENHETPRASKSLFVQGVVVVLIVVVSFTVMSQAQFLVSRVPSVAAVISSVLVELANADRGAQGLATLTVNPALNEVARAKAEHMAKYQYFAHTAPTGETPWHWFREKNYQFLYAGENLAIDFYESSDVNRAWMQSPTHRANIVGTQFTEIGIAVVDGMYQGRPTTYVVQVFATPAPKKAIEPVPAPTTPTTTPRVIVERPVRDIVPAPPAEVPALATTLPTTTQPTVTEVLGQSAGSYLASQPAVPWWYKMIHRFAW